MFAFLPIILNISGVIWKDVHMAFALLLSSSLLIAVAALKPNKKLRYIAIAFSIIFIIYATLVRYNAFISVLPLIYLVAIQFSWASSKLRIGLIMLAVLGTVGVGSVLVNAIAKPQSTHPIAAIMLDDIINAVPRQDIESSNIPDKLKNVLLKSQAKCKAYEAVRNAFWACVDIGPDQEVISISHADQLIGFWSKSVIAHPLSYLSYRAQTFLMFLVVPEDTEYVWHEGITPNELGQTVKFERAENIMKHYIVDWAYRYFPFLFQGWFWLLVGLFTFRLANQKSQFGIYSKSIALSGVLYILLYIPIVVAMDYRYIYWPVIATILAGGLIILDQYTKPRVREKRKS
jgi:hypothetical protein